MSSKQRCGAPARSKQQHQSDLHHASGESQNAQDEKLLRLFAQLRGDGKMTVAGPPPEARTFRIGQSVSIASSAQERVVHALSDYGRLVATRLSARASASDSDLGLEVSHWFDVYPLDASAKDHGIEHDSIACKGRAYDTTLSSLVRMQLEQFDDNPVYQRGYVWHESDQVRLIVSLLRGASIGVFALAVNANGIHTEVIDGKQRLRALLAFYTSRISVNGVYWHELPVVSRRRIMMTPVSVLEFSDRDLTPADRMRLFIELNDSGVPQTREHLDRVRGMLADLEQSPA